MLRAEPAEFFLFLSFTCDILGYTLVANDAKIVHFTFYIYFPGALGPRCFLRATPRHAPHPERSGRSGAGAELVRKLNERERGVKKYGGAGAVSGVTERGVSGDGNFDRSRSAHMLWTGKSDSRKGY